MTDFAYRITHPKTGECMIVAVYERGDTVTLKYNTGQVLTWNQERWQKAQEELQIECIGVLPVAR